MNASINRMELLILCIGNTLRRDDGAAHVLARRIEAKLPAGAEILTAHQLLPEHAEHVARAGVVIIVDASIEGGDSVALLKIGPAASSRPELHGIGAEALLKLAGELAGSPAPAYLCRIPGNDFGHGEGLSPETAERVREAENMLLGFIASAA